MRHRSDDLFSRPGTIETEGLGSRQIPTETGRVKPAIRHVLRNRNSKSHLFRVALLAIRALRLLARGTKQRRDDASGKSNEKRELPSMMDGVEQYDIPEQKTHRPAGAVDELHLLFEISRLHLTE